MRLLLAAGLLVAGCSSPPESARAAKLGKEDFRCTVASITDGDTFRCQETSADGRQIRVRLSGIAARERDGSCSEGHPCPTASSEAATAALSEIAAGQTLSCQREGRTFDRVAAFCQREDGRDLSCAMLKSGTVAKWDRYWGDHACR